MEGQTNDSQMLKLLSDPFTTAMDVQSKMFDKYFTTVKKLAYGESDKKGNRKAEVLKININRLIRGEDSSKKKGKIETTPKIEKVEQEVEVPLISLVKIPALTMKQVQVDLVLGVDTELKSVKLVGGKNQSTDFLPKYTIKMTADREEEAEGMKILTQIMTESVKLLEK